MRPTFQEYYKATHNIELITIKQYAKEKGTTCKEVKKLVNRYAEELYSHIIVDDKTKYLDVKAVTFLDEKRKRDPFIIMQEDKDEQIKELEEENRMLLNRIKELQQTIINDKEQIVRLKHEKNDLMSK